MLKAESIIALSERLRQQSRRSRNHDMTADLRLAALYLRRFASIVILDEAAVERDERRKAKLQDEGMSLWLSGGTDA